jgi:hypothetical protein
MKQSRMKLPQCKVIYSDWSDLLLSLGKPGSEAGSGRDNQKRCALIEAGARQASRVKS